MTPDSNDIQAFQLHRFHWILLILGTAISILFFYRWEIFFYDGIYYLRTISNPELYQFKTTPFDRWTHVNFLWWILPYLGGASASSFQAIQWIYRIIMYLAVGMWCLVFKRCWINKSFHGWGVFFVLTSPLMIYSPSQVLPEQWAFLFMGLGTFLYLFALEKNINWLFLLAGFSFYLGFLSRSDSLLLPAAFLLSALIWEFRPRTKMLLGFVLTGLTFMPALLWHIHKVGGLTNVAPMAQAIWAFKNGIFGYHLQEFGRASGLHALLALLALVYWQEKGTKILVTTCGITYVFFITWIASGHVAYGRHIFQGALVLSALGSLGFNALMTWDASKPWPKWLLRCFVMSSIPFMIETVTGKFAIPSPFFIQILIALWFIFLFAFFSKRYSFLRSRRLAGSFFGITGGFVLWIIYQGMREMLKHVQNFSLSKVIQYAGFLFNVIAPCHIILAMMAFAIFLIHLYQRRNSLWKGLFYCALIVIHIGFANSQLGGVFIDQAKKIFERLPKDKNSVLLISHDPTYFFYQFYYPSFRRKVFFNCYAGGTPEQRRYYQVEIKKVLKDEYIANLSELEMLNSKNIVYVGFSEWSWLGVEPGVSLKILSDWGTYNGYPISEIVLPLSVTNHYVRDQK